RLYGRRVECSRQLTAGFGKFSQKCSDERLSQAHRSQCQPCGTPASQVANCGNNSTSGLYPFDHSERFDAGKTGAIEKVECCAWCQGAFCRRTSSMASRRAMTEITEEKPCRFCNELFPREFNEGFTDPATGRHHHIV